MRLLVKNSKDPGRAEQPLVGVSQLWGKYHRYKRARVSGLSNWGRYDIGLDIERNGSGAITHTRS